MSIIGVGRGPQGNWLLASSGSHTTLFTLLLWGALMLCFQTAGAKVAEGRLSGDTLSILFQRDSVRIDMEFGDNAEHWDVFERNFMRRYGHANPNYLRLDIYSGASPEGPTAYNRWLGEQRGLAIRRLVRQRLGRRVGDIVVHNEGPRWDRLYDCVAMSDESWRDDVMRIIDMPATPNEDLHDHREARLRSLRGGSVWPVLLEKYMAPLRGGATAVLSWQGGRDTIYVRDTVYIEKVYYGRDSIFVIGEGQSGNGPGYGYPGFPGYRDYPGYPGYGYPGYGAAGRRDDEARAARRDSLRHEWLRYPAWAVKTNLLLWGVVAPNVEVEVPLGHRNRWSLEAEYFVPWFVWNRNAHASQFHNLGFELRYWLGNRSLHRWLQGWHMGLAVAAGYYDWEWKKHEGYQGEYVNTYFNIGFQYRWGNHWGLDCALGLGLMATKYRHYYGSSVYGGSVNPESHLEPWDKHLIWHDTGHMMWPGACHGCVSLVYLFNAWPFHTKSRKL